MTPSALRRLAARQTEDGSFPSEVSGPAGTGEDRNGYTTARILRALRDFPPDPQLNLLRRRALAFIERCRSRSVAGAFCFWPEDARPDWADRVPADIDDTAIMTIELLRYRRMSQHLALRTVCTILLPHRMVDRPEVFRPSWIEQGSFLTWIGPPGQPNVVDCCINANALALMGLVRASHLPGYREALRTILNGLEWAGHDPVRLRSLTPFYPSLDDLQEAVEHAIECGVSELAPALVRLRCITRQRDQTSSGCCSSAYGATVWHCPALDEAQCLRRAIGNRFQVSGTMNQISMSE